VNFSKFSRKRFVVEALQITDENIAEVAELIGDLQHELESGTPFIVVDPTKIPHGHRVYVGHWLTRMGKNLRCYKPEIFASQFEAVK
jgi:hypothetical protein